MIAAGALCIALAPFLPANARTTVLVNAIAPVTSTLYIANADGSGERPLLRAGKFDYDASFSADGKWIVFTSERDGPANIFKVRRDGTGLKRLTRANGFQDQAALSPDGSRLAFVSTRDGGHANIWLKDLKTGKLRNLTGSLPATPRMRRSHLRPAWSPDGRWIAFSSDRDTPFEPHVIPAPGWEHIQRSSVYVIGADGSGLRRLSDGIECAGSPKWSADGKRIVYYSLPVEQTFAARIVGLKIGDIEAKRIDGKLISVDVESGARTDLKAAPGLGVSPQFVGPDRVGYLRKGPGFEKGTLAYVEESGGGDVSGGSAPGDLRNPAWSPDGAFVVYQRFRYGLKQGQPLYSPDKAFTLRFSAEFPAVSAKRQVAVTPFPHDPTQPPTVALVVGDVGGSNMRKIYDPGAALMAPTWSPDGRQLIVSKGVLELGAPLQLVQLNADGSGVRPLTDPAVSSAFPSYAPDGRQVVYRVRAKNQAGLRVLDLATGTSRVLTDQADNFPFWSPDGKLVCFTRTTGGEQAFDIFTIRPDGTDLRQVTATPGNDSHCAWTQDGRLIFSSSQLGFRDEAALYDSGQAQPYSEQFITNADGSNARPITDDKWEQGTPALVPGD